MLGVESIAIQVDIIEIAKLINYEIPNLDE
jgi:hypothetical protein